MLREELEKAIAAHGMWKARLRLAVRGGELDVKVEEAKVDDRCEFGRWLRTGMPPELRGSVRGRRSAELHREFHLAVGEVVRLVLLKRGAEAERELDAGQFFQKSSALTRELMAWIKEEGAVLAVAPAPTAVTTPAAPASGAPSIDKQIETALAAHGVWKSRIRAAVETGRCDVPLLTIRANDRCEFGRWLGGGELTAAQRASPAYRKVDELHRQFHLATAHVVELAVTGRKAEAERESQPTAEFGRTSTALTRALMEWSRSART